MTSKRSRETSAAWLTEHFLQLLLGHDLESHLEAGLEIFRKRRVLDFTVAPGSISAKIQTEGSDIYACSIILKPLSDKEWQQVFHELAKQSLYIAKLFAGMFPAELAEGFQQAGCELLPNNSSTISLKSNCKDKSLALDCFAALYFRFSETVENDPFVIFTLRGKGRDESIFQIRRERNNLLKAQPSNTQSQTTAALDTHKKLLASRLDKFWSAGAGLSELSYSIRADELPAAILKWLDPMPLQGIEEDADRQIEEGYEQVTRRAQAYGLGL